MAELELKGIEYFRKGTTIRKVNEDPTLLSFMFVFNTGSVADSPLLTNKPGGALDYLENVVNAGADNEGKGPGYTYAESLKNFQKLLLKINKEMPWFWQSISGLETTMQYGNMQDPYWGKDKKIEIECLEENVELMGLSLMRLYRDACFDFQRWVEIIPENLRKFSVDIFVSEVRTFQQDLTARDKDLFGNLPKGSLGKEDTTEINTEMHAAAKPFYHVQLGHCTWDMDSTNDILASLSRNPEVKKPKLTFFYKTVRTPDYRWGANLGVSQEVLIEPKKDPTVDAYNPANPILGAAKSKFAKLKDKAIGGTVAKLNNLAQGITGGPGLGNANGKILGGAAANIAGSLIEDAVGSILLDNVHGVSTLSTVAGAIQQGSINGLINAAGQIAGNLGVANINTGGGKLPSIYDGPGIDSSPDGNISPKKVYDAITPDRDDAINDNVYGGVNTGVDSTPDGNLNDNIHE